MIRTHGSTHFDPDNCFGCHVLTVQMSPPTFEPHYNYSVGQYVSNWKEFNDALKKASDVQSERTGIYSSYEPLHPADVAASPPPETAPSHLDRLSDIDSDPTLDAHRDSLRRERDRQRASASESAQTQDLIKREIENASS